MSGCELYPMDLWLQHNDQGMQQTVLRGQLNDYPTVLLAKHLIGCPMEKVLRFRCDENLDLYFGFLS